MNLLLLLLRIDLCTPKLINITSCNESVFIFTLSAGIFILEFLLMCVHAYKKASVH